MLFYIRIRLTIILLTHACCSRQQDGEIFNFVRLSPTDAENTGLSNVDAGDGLLAQHMVCKRCGSAYTYTGASIRQSARRGCLAMFAKTLPDDVVHQEG